MASLKQNTWTLDQWYDQDVAGNVSYKGSGELWIEGRNNEYQCDGAFPNSPNSRKSSPVQLSGNWVDGASAGDGAMYAFGVRGDGSVWVWGKSNTSGSLGLNQPAPTSVTSPKQVMAAPSTGYVTRIVSHETRTMVVQDGKLWVWGSNSNGGLGLNEGPAPNLDGVSSPTQVGTEATWSENISTNAKFTMGVKTDGTLWAWGGNSSSGTYGQLGQNEPDNIQYSSPTQIGSDTDWSTERGGCDVNYSAGCVKSTGELFLWGRNGDQGVLGHSESGGQDANSRSSPLQLPGTTWKTCQINYNMACSVKTNGQLWTWGSNAYGNLGLNQKGNHTTGQSYSSPKQCGTSTNWSMVWSRGSMCWGTKTDGTLWSWGQNGSLSYLGHNSQVSLSSPAQIGTDTDWSLTAQYLGAGGPRNMWFKYL